PDLRRPQTLADRVSVPRPGRGTGLAWAVDAPGEPAPARARTARPRAGPRPIDLVDGARSSLEPVAVRTARRRSARRRRPRAQSRLLGSRRAAAVASRTT